MNYLGRKLTPEKKPRRPIRKLGRLGKLRAKGKRDAKLKYLNGDRFGRCQSCQTDGESNELEIHHKLKCSQGGKENPENLICICRRCHAFIHQPGYPERERFVLAQVADALNGKAIEWEHHTNALTKWRLAWR